MQDIRMDIWRHLENALRQEKDHNDSKRWTVAVKAGLASLRPVLAKKLALPNDKLRAFHNADGLPEPKTGEYMLDFAWTTYPYAFTWTEEVLAQEGEGHGYQLLLAAESEWGDWNAKENFTKVLDDFCKLVDVKAPFKVMVYGYRTDVGAGHPGAPELKKAFTRILRAHRFFDATERWLFVGVSWDGDWDPLVDVLDETSFELTPPPWT